MKLKVCGMKYADNIKQIAALQPDYMGFIFWEPSKRYFEGAIPELPESIKKVGVFVDEDKRVILEKVNTYQLQAVQLHGRETPNFCKNLKEKLAPMKIDVIKVFSVQNDFDFSTLKGYDASCDSFLFDTKGKLPGGNGYAFDWKVLENYPSTKPYFLSGGIGLNELDSLKVFLTKPEAKYCHAIDVNSKFELEPGLKNIASIQEFKSHIRS